MRIGVLGGSFNPPHVGHLLLASDAFERLSLDRLVIVPASANPLKGIEAQGAAARQRLEMTRLAFDGDERFDVSDMEIERGGLSFTVDTLEALASLHPDAELVLLIGMDSLGTMDRWRRPDRISELARLAVMARSGSDSNDEKLPAGAELVTTRRIDISSTEIRQRVARGLPVKGYVTEAVESYIATANLYAESTHATPRDSDSAGD